MTAARLSPSATLLRNSKLFALPPPIPLPGARASAEPVARSDTATNPWPVRAAIETPVLSRTKGDWGLKRPLPLKSTTKSGTPVIRIQRGIDTREHIADFESAADHVLTLQKWQTLNMPLSLAGRPKGTPDERSSHSVFNSWYDNAQEVPQFASSEGKHTGIWPDIEPAQLDAMLPQSLLECSKRVAKLQELEKDAKDQQFSNSSVSQSTKQRLKAQKRWRYAGPWLAGMTGMEFETYLEHVVRSRRREFRERVKAYMVAENKTADKEKAIVEGLHDGEESAECAVYEPSAEEVEEYVKTLRSRKALFGTLITEFLDLPDGPRPNNSDTREWKNGRDTAASEIAHNVGPPPSHPSAGLSYIRRRSFSENDPLLGPQFDNTPVVGRVLKMKRFANANQANQSESTPTIGVAGFVAENLRPSDIRGGVTEPIPQKGGRKYVVIPSRASLNAEGGIDLSMKEAFFHELGDNVPVRKDMKPPPLAAEETRDGRLGERLDTRSSRRPPRPDQSRLRQTMQDRQQMKQEKEGGRGETEDLLKRLDGHY